MGHIRETEKEEPDREDLKTQAPNVSFRGKSSLSDPCQRKRRRRRTGN